LHDEGEMAKGAEEQTCDVARSELCWRLRARGYTQEQIAAEIGVDQSTVSRVLNRVGQQLLAEMHEQQKQQQIETHARLENLFGEAMSCWYLSRGPDQKGIGDVKYLDAAVRIIARFCKLWGLDKPVPGLLGIVSGHQLSPEMEEIIMRRMGMLPQPEPQKVLVVEPAGLALAPPAVTAENPPPASPPEPLPVAERQQHSEAEMLRALDAMRPPSLE
jgi:hypothetical protein